MGTIGAAICWDVPWVALMMVKLEGDYFFRFSPYLGLGSLIDKSSFMSISEGHVQSGNSCLPCLPCLPHISLCYLLIPTSPSTSRCVALLIASLRSRSRLSNYWEYRYATAGRRGPASRPHRWLRKIDRPRGRRPALSPGKGRAHQRNTAAGECDSPKA